MIEQPTIEHHIQRYIVAQLIRQEFARFRDLRPPHTDTNLFSYHLKSLTKAGYISKTDKGYTLSHRGLIYADRFSQAKTAIREQPKIITMIRLINRHGEVLLQRRDKQPYIGTWTLPYGKLHMEDASLRDAARREAKEKLGRDDFSLAHAGDCYIRVFAARELLSFTYAHIFTGEFDGTIESDTIRLVAPGGMHRYQLAPAINHIVALPVSAAPFFTEIRADWYTKDNDTQ